MKYQVEHDKKLDIKVSPDVQVAQMAASILQVPLELITVKATDTLTGNNGGETAISLTTEMACRVMSWCCCQPVSDQKYFQPFHALF